MFTVRQLSVFLENKPGRLCAATDAIAKEGININALTLADTTEFGILRLIVDAPDRAAEILRDIGVVVRVTKVLAIAMNDAPGGAGDILHILAGAGLNIEYMYVCVGSVSGQPIMVVRTDDIESASDVLNKAGYKDVDPADIYRI
ncbi:MAG: ACT domain-containing protein [Acutalibacteraceae bacterium]|nr:amino acid-binding protein [Clostridia bacterium]MEE1126671.1 ACT domain-containing protein [Acutalibacteraceae bacterium]